MPSLPYVFVYQVGSNTVHIVRVLHGSQEWPR
jgi:plasmid stabilization system protein ParE